MPHSHQVFQAGVRQALPPGPPVARPLVALCRIFCPDRNPKAQTKQDLSAVLLSNPTPLSYSCSFHMHPAIRRHSGGLWAPAPDAWLPSPHEISPASSPQAFYTRERYRSRSSLPHAQGAAVIHILRGPSRPLPESALMHPRKKQSLADLFVP